MASRIHAPEVMQRYPAFIPASLFWLPVLFVFVFVLTTTFTTTTNAFSAEKNPNQAVVGTTRNIATQILQGVGMVTTEQRNLYNIRNLDDIQAEWTLYRVQAQNENKSTLRLGCRSKDRIMVDTLQVQFPRTANGLGLELLELAGSSIRNTAESSGLGITIVTNVNIPTTTTTIPVDIIPGDSLVRVALIRRQVATGGATNRTIQSNKTTGTPTPFVQTEEQFHVTTECLDFDATAQAIQSLPRYPETATASTSGYDEIWSLTLKRLRRRPKVNVTVRYPPNNTNANSKASNNAPAATTTTVVLNAGENLRYALMVRGIFLNDPTAQRFDGKASGTNCGAGGLCRTCRIHVEAGSDLLNPQRPAERTMMYHAGPRARLACKAIVGYGMKEGDLVIKAYPDQWKRND
jgi:ferredoxin